MNKIPLYGIDRQYSNLREEILDVTDSVYSSGYLLDSKETLKFEQSIQDITERKYACAVNSGTQALTFALRAMDFYNVFRKNKVLIPTQSFVATVNSVIEAGMDPVFCDVDPITGLIDLNKIDVPIDELAAVMYVNLFGNIIDYDKLQVYKEFWSSHRIYVIEDAAQSFGAYYRGVPSGKLGDISVLSFDPTKNLNNYGSGGMVLTDDPSIWECVNDLHNNGKGNEHVMSGTNSKMSEADCAQMLVKLKYFDQWQLRRRLIAEYYTDQLDGYVTIPDVHSNVEHAWSKFVIHHIERGNMAAFLGSVGISTKITYTKPLHLENISFEYVSDQGQYDGAEQFSRTCLSLPIYPELTDPEVEHIVDAIKEYIS